MKAGWQRQRLASVAVKITDGSHNPPKGVPESDFLMLSSKNVFDDDLHYAEPRYLTAEQYQQEDKRTGIIPGDVLLTIVGTVGRSAVVPSDAPRMTLQRSVAVIRPISEIVKPRFLMYSFMERNAELNELARGVAQKGIYLETLRELEVMLPPLPEQHRIVAILDEAFDGIATAKANAEKNLQNARALFESHLQSVFTERGEGWVDSTIGECIRFIDYRGKTPVKTDRGLRLITAKNVKMGYLQESPMEFVAPESYEAWMTRGIPRRGDVLFTTEAPLANVAQLNTDDKVVFAQRIIIMQPDASWLDSTFLKYLLLSQPVQHRIHGKGTGATVKGIKASLLKTIEISFPASIDVQQAIVSKLDDLTLEVEHLESLHQQKLTALADLKKSLLHQAFSGQL
jgi:type I restriction enzyme S subunit